MTRAALYIRVSTDEQAQHGYSIPAQREKLEAYCAAQGWVVVRAYVDDGYSGADLDRPGLQQMVTDARAGAWDVLLVYKLDRLSRRQRDILYLLEDVLEPCGVGLRSATEPFDTTTPFGRAALGMLAVFAQLERETIVERITLAKAKAAREGRWRGSVPPYGYRHDPERKTIVVSEPEAQVVRLVYELALRGMGARLISEHLEEQKIPPPANERLWYPEVVRRMLKNPVYAGLTSHKGQLYPGAHEAIIPPETWRRVQEVLRNRARLVVKQRTAPGLLAGLLWCAECGARVRCRPQWVNWPDLPKRVYWYYRCYSVDKSNRAMIRDPNCRMPWFRIERVDGSLESMLLDQGWVQQAVERAAAEVAAAVDREAENQRSRAEQLRARLAEVERKLARWYRAYERGALDADELAERVASLREQKRQLEREIRDADDLAGKRRAVEEQAQLVKERVRELPSLWSRATPEEKRELIRMIVQRVWLHRDGTLRLEFLGLGGE